MHCYLTVGYPQAPVGLVGLGQAGGGEGIKLHVLLSYHYYKQHDLFELFAKYFSKPWPDVFLDSGAFSAHTQGQAIDIGAYAEWVKHHEALATTYANLDVIEDAVATERNQRELERRGLQPLPVFHTREPWAVLQGLVARYPYVGLGAMVGKRNRAALRAWIAKCFAIAGDRTVFHGFGMTSWSLLKGFRWYSVDSTTWSAGQRWRNALVFDPYTGLTQINIAERSKLWRYRRNLWRMGMPLSMQGNEATGWQATIRAGAVAMMQAERWLSNRGTPVSIYLASGSPADFEGLAEAWQALQYTTN